MATSDTPSLGRAEAWKLQMFDAYEAARTRAADLKENVREATGEYAGRARDTLTVAGKGTCSFLGKGVDHLTSYETTAVLSGVGAALYYPQKIAVHTRIQRYLVPALLLAFPVKVAASLIYKFSRSVALWGLSKYQRYIFRSGGFLTKLQNGEAATKAEFVKAAEQVFNAGYKVVKSKDDLVVVQYKGLVFDEFISTRADSYKSVEQTIQAAKEAAPGLDTAEQEVQKLVSARVEKDNEETLVSEDVESILKEISSLGFNISLSTDNYVILRRGKVQVANRVEVGESVAEYIRQAEKARDFFGADWVGMDTKLTESVYIRKR